MTPVGRRDIGVPMPRQVGARAVGSLCVIALLAAGCDSAKSSSPGASPTSTTDDSYGALPTFLPSSAIQPNSTLTGNAARPALTVEGDAVRVILSDATGVSMTVSGPVVPGEGLPNATEAPTCTWTVRMRSATGNVPISAADFNTLDHLGKTYRVAFVPGQPRPPATLTPGMTVTFELRAVMPNGEGLMRWAPDGRHILASWDFEVEND